MGNDVTKKGTIQFKRKTATEWAALNPILLDGEPGVERVSDPLAPRKIKIGDGITPWNQLPFQPQGTGTSGGGTVDDTALNAALATKADVSTTNSALALKADAAAVQTALSIKVNNSDLTTALAGKADTAALNSGLAAKANVSDLNAKADAAGTASALAAKADTTALNTGLALKVDKTALTTALALKSDETSVTSRLAAKADTTALTAALATKADASALAAKADASALAAKADTTTVNAALATKISATATDKPMEVELVTTRNSGKISSVNGSLVASSDDQYSGFIPVTPGEKIMITMRSTEINTSPPETYAGIAGYAAADYATFVTAPDADGFMKGNIFNLYRFNYDTGADLRGHHNFVNIIKTIPAGVNFINGSSCIEVDGGLPLSIKAIRNVGTVQQSIAQLYDLSHQNTSDVAAGGGGTTSRNEFTDDEKAKLALIQTPTASFVTKGVGNAIQFTDVATGLTYLGYVRNGEWIVEGNTRTLRSLSYPVGYSYDQAKESAGYKTAANDAIIWTPENGMGPGHIQPGLATGFTQFVPGQNSLRYDFAEADYIVGLAQSKGIKIHGAHLTWHTVPPTGDPGVKAHIAAIATNNPGNEKAKLTEYLKEMIPAIINHYITNFPGTVISWNVMNEMFNGTNGAVTTSFWNTWFPDINEFAEVVFTAATVPNGPDRYTNDYGYEAGNANKSNNTISLINTLKAKNITVNGRLVQVDGIGSQMHAGLNNGEPDLTNAGNGVEVFRDKLVILAATGLKIMLTELDLRTGSPWTDALAERQAKAYYNIFESYERAVPPAQRGGIIMWTVGDSAYIDNINKGYTPPGGANPAPQFPAINDWYYVPKPAKARILTVLDRFALTADVYMDFMATPDTTEIAGTSTKGFTPLPWVKAGYTTGAMGITSIGLRAAQTSQNSRTTVYVDYPYANRTFITKMFGILAMGSRTGWLNFKYVDESNGLSVRLSNTTDVYIVVKRSGGVDTTLLTTAVKPTKGDEIKLTMIDGTYTLYINNIVINTFVESAFIGATKAGVSLKGYDDKFTSIDQFMMNKI